MGNLTNLLDGIASSVASQVGSAITSVLGFIVNGVNKDVIQPVSTGISDALNAVERGVSSLQSAASNGINNTLNAAALGIEKIIATSEVGFNSVLGGVETGIQTIATSISTVFHEIVSGVNQGFTAIESGVAQSIIRTADLVKQGLDDVGNIMGTVLRTTLEPIAHFLESLPATIETIAEGVGKNVLSLTEEVSKIVLAADKIVATAVPDLVIKGIESIPLDQIKESAAKLFTPIIASVAAKPGVVNQLAFDRAVLQLAVSGAAEVGIGVLATASPSVGFILGSLLNNISEAVNIGALRELADAGNNEWQNRALEMSELVQARYRGHVSEEAYVKEFAKQGISKDNADIVFKSAETLLGAADLISLYKRGAITDIKALQARAQQIRVPAELVDEMLVLYKKLLGPGEAIEMWRRGVLPKGWTDPFDDLRREGFTDERIDALKGISYTRPSIFEFQDIVARKVDDEAHVAKFGLDEGINDEYFALAKLHGYEEKDARRLYRMYWNLPPFFAVVQEFKTGKLSEADFRDAMSFLRFTPYWQDVFARSLKPSLTQGDIKDLYKYEVITADEIVPRLMELNVAKDLAEQLSELWQASVKLAAPNDRTGTQTDVHALKGETSALVTTAYKDSLLSPADAEAQLIALGKSEESAKLILAIADHEMQQQTIKDVFAIDKDSYLGGNITLEEVITDLSNAGATMIQQTKFINQLQRSGRSKPKMPSLADFDKWFKKQIIDASELVAGLQLLGYTDTWIPFYLLEAGVTAEAVAAMGYNIGVPTQA